MHVHICMYNGCYSATFSPNFNWKTKYSRCFAPPLCRASFRTSQRNMLLNVIGTSASVSHHSLPAYKKMSLERERIPFEELSECCAVPFFRWRKDNFLSHQAKVEGTQRALPVPMVCDPWRFWPGELKEQNSGWSLPVNC